MIVAVIGAGQCSQEQYDIAHEVGRLIAKSGAMLVSGGLTGVMEAASHGAKDAGGVTIGILPGSRKEDANPYIDIPIVTAASHMRNIIIANTADVIIAIFGSYGTLSEVAIALKLGKKVIGIDTWDIKGVIRAASPKEAVELAGTYES